MRRRNNVNKYIVATRDHYNQPTDHVVTASWYRWGVDHVSFHIDQANAPAKMISSFAASTVTSVVLSKDPE